MKSAVIEGFEDYVIYENGDIISFKRYKEGKKIKPELNKSNGYLMICLRTKDGARFNNTIHRLLAKAFIPNPDNKPCIDHIDRNRQNNELSNLRWVSYIENNNNFTPRNGSIYGTILKGCINPTYIFTQYIQGKRHTKRFKTLEDAQAYQKEYNEKIKINNNI
jgi:hypothetical protein